MEAGPPFLFSLVVNDQSFKLPIMFDADTDRETTEYQKRSRRG